MTTALIYGATGLVGSHLLTQILENPAYDKVRVLTRKPLEIKHEKLIEIQYDFEHPDANHLKADHIFCALGTTMKKAGSRKKFYRIDHDFVVETAQLCQEQGARLFSYVSAIGANSKSRIFYNRVKGEIEDDLLALAYESTHIFRPSILLGKRNEFRLLEGISQSIIRKINFLLPPAHRGVKAEQVAEAMGYHALNHSDSNLIIENRDIIMLKASSDEK
jgi:uncharacterized protein YbjT (DUF2867 family)